MISADLGGTCALVTGAASGFGLAAARLFARCGATVALNDLPGERLDAAVEALRGEGLAVLAAPGDVGEPEGAAAMVERAAAGLGRLDWLLNNAGTPGTRTPIPYGDLDALDEAFWQRLLSVNLLGPYRCTRAAAPWLRASRGAVVNTASSAAFGLPASSVAYAASKAALVNMTLNLAKGLAPEVRVNAVAPGFSNTPWTEHFEPEWVEAVVSQIPLGRAGEPEDMAEAMLYLCAGAGYMTGRVLRLDGGI